MATPQDTATLAADSLFNVKGLVAVVTGGGTGIGLMMAKALALNGAAKVFILGRRLPVLEEAVASIGAAPGVVEPVTCDVTSTESLQAAAAAVSSASGGFVNLLVCNSGVSGPQTAKATKGPGSQPTGLSLAEWADSQLAAPPADFTQTLHVNVSAVWYTAMAFLRLLDAGNARGNAWQRSQVVATSSIGGFNKTSTGGYAYGVSKAACTHLVKQLAVALPQWGIRANVIAPGLYPSEMSAPILGGLEIGQDVVPLERMGDEKDMAGALLYLTSRAGAYCNGSVIVTDGGRLGLFPSTF